MFNHSMLSMQTVLLLFAACFGFRGAAQSAVENQYNELTVRALTSSGGMAPVATAFDTRYEGVRGSPLLFETWQSGTLQVKGKEEPVFPVKLNINLEKQIAAVCYLNGSIGLLRGDLLDGMTFETGTGQQRFMVLPGNEVDPARSAEPRFYEVLFQGDKFVFLKYRFREFRKADYKGAYATQVRYDEYVEESHYFIRYEDKPFAKVRLRANLIEKQFSEWGRAIPSGTDLNTESGVISMLKAIDLR